MIKNLLVIIAGLLFLSCTTPDKKNTNSTPLTQEIIQVQGVLQQDISGTKYIIINPESRNSKSYIIKQDLSENLDNYLNMIVNVNCIITMEVTPWKLEITVISTNPINENIEKIKPVLNF